VVGVADRERRLPMSQQALLHAGSAGKTLFAALALQLVAEGRMGRPRARRRALARAPGGDSSAYRGGNEMAPRWLLALPAGNRRAACPG
jgi:hypothetical protein